MNLNEALIPHYKCVIIPMHDLKTKVLLSEKYLKEKPTWYEIDNKLKYFKIRNDFRLFTEQFFSRFGNEILDLDTLDYQVASVRTIDKENPNGGEKKIGLLSDNFQNKKEFNYYLISELLETEISDLVSYGYTLKGILEFLRNELVSEDYKKCEEFLIKLFIADSFTMQLDRNPNNIGFQIPKIDGIDYKQRLRKESLIKTGHTEALKVDKDNFIKLKVLVPSKVYDNERILGVDHKDVFLHNAKDVWTPIWPYNEDLLFNTQEEARQVQDEIYDGFDPNLIELIINHPEYRYLIERLAKDDEYRKILEDFTKPTSQVCLSQERQEYFEDILGERRKVFQKVLTL